MRLSIIPGLMFNKAADSCDYSRNVICNKKSEKTAAATTTTTLKTTSLASTTNKPGTTTTTTTTTTTEAPAVEEDYEEEDADSQEDPKAIKQLITLIKKLGKEILARRSRKNYENFSMLGNNVRIRIFRWYS